MRTVLHRRAFLAGTAALVLSASMVHAQTQLEGLISELQADGFVGISAKKTLLGRIRILAHREGEEREIVLNPATGVILRDYTRYSPSILLPLSPQEKAARRRLPPRNGDRPPPGRGAPSHDSPPSDP